VIVATVCRAFAVGFLLFAQRCRSQRRLAAVRMGIIAPVLNRMFSPLWGLGISASSAGEAAPVTRGEKLFEASACPCVLRLCTCFSGQGHLP